MATQFFFGTTGADTINGSDAYDPAIAFDDIIHGFGGADYIYAGAGDDWVWSSTLSTEGGHFYGGAGDDVLVGYGGADWLQGDAGNDVLIGGADNDTMIGGDGDDWVWGLEGHDWVNGGTGADVLVGGPGLDTLVAGLDNLRDVMIGDAGGDNYAVARGGSSLAYSLLDPRPTPPAGGANIIWGFEIGVDRLTVPTPSGAGGGGNLAIYNSWSSTQGYNAELGLTGTMITLEYARGIGAQGATTAWAFLAGVDTTLAALQGAGSFATDDVILAW
jgi:Ca2+-binding RTX toxin-like protein